MCLHLNGEKNRLYIQLVDILHWQDTILAGIRALLSHIMKNKQRFSNTQGLNWQSQTLQMLKYRITVLNFFYAVCREIATSDVSSDSIGF